MSEFLDRIAKLPPKRLVLLAADLQARLERAEHARSEPIAVIGMACRFPGGADSPATYWQLLRDGVDAITTVPRERFDVDLYYDPNPDAPGKMATRWGGFLRDVDRFDAPLFGIAPREAQSMDPQQRLLLEVTWEALEDAGLSAERLAGSRTGVFVGICNSDYYQMLLDVDPSMQDAYVATGGAHSVAAGRIAYVLGVQGPNMAIDTACSSSLVAVHLAAQSLRAGECRAALAAGVNLVLAPHVTVLLSRGRMMAPDGRCKAFDARANGFVRAEGCGVVVLKRLDDALADGDTVLAVIRGSAVNQDGRSNGLTAPNGPSQESVIRDALANAGVAAAEVAYVEAHGTGTSLGDPIELQALGAALGTGRPADRPLLVGSVKTNIGHLESAAGVAGLIKTVLALRHGEIPASLHFEQPNPHIAWDRLPVRITARRQPWPPGARIAGVSSLGFSGTNAHVIVEAAPPVTANAPAAPGASVLTLSARSEPALRRLTGRWAQALASAPAMSLADVAFTANTGRSAHEHRLAVIAGDCAEAGEAMARIADGGALTIGGRAGRRAPGVAFLFTGQGAQWPGMGRDLYDREPVFRAALDRCAAALGDDLKEPLLDVLWGPSSDRLDDTRWTQPALFAIEWALAELWRAWGVEPAAVLGHSAGEYAAACVAGVLEVEDAIRLVAARGRVIGALPPGGAMTAAWEGEARVREIIAPWPAVQFAAVNGPAAVVLSGPVADVEAAGRALEAASVKTERLRVSYAAHSSMLDPMLGEFATVAAAVTYRPATVPFVSTLTGRLASPNEVARAEYWVRQTREPVRFGDAVCAARAAGCEIFVEAGPHPVLAGLGQQSVADALWVGTLRRGRTAREQVLEAAATLWTRGVPVDMARVQPGRRVSGLPTYPFERERHWVRPSQGGRRTAGASASAHPLLGERVRSALSTPHFEVTLSATSPVFLGHHRVHGAVIAPASLYVEMALAAAARTLGGDASGALSDLVIDRPLLLPEGAERIVQTLVRDEAGAMRVEIVALDGDGEASSWVRHAGVTIEHSRPPAGTADLDAIRTRCAVDVPAATHYARLREHGVDFGPAFQGVVRIGRATGEALAEVEVPESVAGETSRYVVHPAVLDACLQALGAAWPADEEETYLVVGADRAWLSPCPGRVWSHAVLAPATIASTTRAADVRLMDEHGRLVGEVLGVRLRRARREALELAASEAPGDWLYEVTWEPSPLPDEPACASASSPSPAALAAQVEPAFRALAGAPAVATYDAVVPALEALASRYIVAALGELGWTPVVGERVAVDALAKRLGVVTRHRRLLGRLLAILAEDGFLRVAADGWEVAATPPALDPESLHAELLQQYGVAATELDLTRDCGRALADVLCGVRDPLPLLFSDDVLARTASIYAAGPVARVYNQLVAEVVTRALAALPPGPCARILEIGAGTGGTTGAVLPAVEGRCAEYVVTDVSPRFTARAAETFAAFGFVRCQSLDIEREPTAQDFNGGRYDIVVAANVVHATRDLARTLDHVRELLAPGGLLVLLEGTRPHRWVDITFGLTEGWWRFADRTVRPDYPLLEPSRWIEVLAAAGFEGTAILSDAHARPALTGQAVLVAQRGKSLTAVRPWLVRADAGGVGQAVADRLRARGYRCLLVAPDAVQPTLAHLASEGGCRGVVDCSILDAPPPEELSPERVRGELVDRTGGIALVARTLAAVGGDEPGRLWLVTRGAQAVTRNDGGIAVAQAAAWGLGRVVALEHPMGWGGLIDLDPEASVDVCAAQVVSQLMLTHDEDQVAFRDGQRFVPRLTRRASMSTPPVALSGDGSYLVTGGLGGLGLKVARWLAEHGARHLVLVGRRGAPPRESWPALPAESDAYRQVAAITAIEALGSRVDVVAADVTDVAEMRRLLAALAFEDRPLRGVVHTAAGLRTDAVADLTTEALDVALAAKAAGAWILHALTRELALDFFVLFSSTTALIGSSGLGHYAAANALLDALAHHRRRGGAAALAVNWGTWEEMRTASTDDRRRYVQGGLRPMPVAAALEALGGLLGDDSVQATVASIEWPVLKPLYEARRRRPFLTHVGRLPAPASAAQVGQAGLRAQLAAASPERHSDIVINQVRTDVGQILGLAPADIDAERGLFNMGMDSLMALDVKTRLEAAVGARLPSTLTFNYPTVTALAGYLLEHVLELGSAAKPIPVGMSASVYSEAVAGERDDMSEDELAALLAAKLGRIR